MWGCRDGSVCLHASCCFFNVSRESWCEAAICPPWSRFCPSCSRGTPAWGRRRWRGRRRRWPPQPGTTTRTDHSAERHLQDTSGVTDSQNISRGIDSKVIECISKHVRQEKLGYNNEKEERKLHRNTSRLFHFIILNVLYRNSWTHCFLRWFYFHLGKFTLLDL